MNSTTLGASFADAVRKAAETKWRILMRHRERYAKAWMAVTGLSPAQTELAERSYVDAEGKVVTVVTIQSRGTALAAQHAANVARRQSLPSPPQDRRLAALVSWLSDNTVEWSFEVNPHRSYCQSPEDFLKEDNADAHECPREIQDQIVAAGRIVKAQAYPISTNGFVRAYGVDTRETLARLADASHYHTE